MAAYNESIVAYFGGDTKGLQAAITSANVLLKGFGSSAGKTLKGIATGFGGAFLAGGLAKGFLSAANAAQELRDKAYESGAAVDSTTMALARSADLMDSVGHAGATAFGAITETVQNLTLYLSSFVVGLDVAADAYNRLQKDVDPAKLAAAQKKLAEAQRETAMAGVSEQQKMNLLLQDNIKLREAAKNPELNELQRIGAQLELEKNIKAIRESDSALRKETAQQEAKDEAERVRSIEKAFDLADKEREFLRDGLPLQEQVNALKADEVKLARELMDPTLSVDELLEKQNRHLEVQKDLREKNKELAEQTAKAQAIQVELTAKNNKLYSDFMSQLLGFGDKRDFTQGSDASLQEIVNRNRNKIGTLDKGSAFDYGDSLTISQLENEANKAQQELDFRKGFRSDLQLGGVDQARRNFQGDPLQFDKVLQQLTTGLDANKETSDTLKRIEDFLTGT